MALCLVEGDLCAAEALLKRAGPGTEGSDISVLAVVCYHFHNSNIGAAISVLRSRDWSDDISSVIISVIERARDRYLKIVAQAYTSIELSQVSTQLNMEQSQCISGGYSPRPIYVHHTLLSCVVLWTPSCDNIYDYLSVCLSTCLSGMTPSVSSSMRRAGMESGQREWYGISSSRGPGHVLCAHR